PAWRSGRHRSTARNGNEDVCGTGGIPRRLLSFCPPGRCPALRQAGGQYCSASSFLGAQQRSLLPLLPKKGGEGRGEEAVFHQLPLSPALAPVVPRGERGKNALGVFHAGYARVRKRIPPSAKVV